MFVKTEATTASRSFSAPVACFATASGSFSASVVCLTIAIARALDVAPAASLPREKGHMSGVMTRGRCGGGRFGGHGTITIFEADMLCCHFADTSKRNLLSQNGYGVSSHESAHSATAEAFASASLTRTLSLLSRITRRQAAPPHPWHPTLLSHCALIRECAHRSAGG